MLSGKNEIAIKDACILFDLVDLNLLDDFFQLDLVVFTTPQVIGEITHETQWNEVSKFVDNNKLKIDTEGDYNSILEIMEAHAGLSPADSSVLELAIRKNAVIFSSDGSLRKVSIKKGIIVRGVLWIIEELYNKNLITNIIALQKLKQYSAVNQRAPVKEIDALINKLSTDKT